MPRRNIPTKAELIQLQKLYKTDEKIAERLGNVSPQLVAYWRRKKNIPKHSFPKFSPEEIKEIWERFGDDYRSGLELGISKAAFYNWRRRYGLKDKPAFLKLEQLELDLGGPDGNHRRNLYGSQTIVQKILAQRSGREKVQCGDEITVEPDLALSNDIAGLVLKVFDSFDASYVWNPNRIIIPLDHMILPQAENTAELHREVREFVRRQNIKYFYDYDEGICHQVVLEKAHALPGQLAIGTDSGILALGCLGLLGISTGIETMARVWSEGKFHISVPGSVRIVINGKMPKAVFARDVALFIAGNLPEGSLKGKVVEFYGTTVSQMPISERFALCDQIKELGPLSVLVPFDSITRRYLNRKTSMPYRPALADKDAEYEQNYEFNIDSLVPQVACPHSIRSVHSAAEIEGQPLQHVIIGTASGGRFEDIRIAADILKGKFISENVRLIVCPGSRGIFLEALKKGLVRAFIDAGAMVINASSVPWQLNHQGYLAAGDNCLATIPSNHQGALGSAQANVFLSSPATAAVSAIKGVITDPTGFIK